MEGIMKVRQWSKRLLAITAIGMLAACGGSSDRVTLGPDYAEGLWAGQTHSGGTLDGVILETGEYWLVFGANNVARSMITGTGYMDGRILRSDNGVDYYFRQAAPFASTLAAEVVQRQGMSGSMYIGNVLERFDLGYVRGYDFPANPNELVGSWQGSATTMATVDALTMSIGADGNFAATLSGCSYAGSVVPRGNGRNVFHFVFENLPSCPYQFRAEGVAVSTAGRLVFTGTTRDRQDAFYAVLQ